MRATLALAGESVPNRDDEIESASSSLAVRVARGTLGATKLGAIHSGYIFKRAPWYISLWEELGAGRAVAQAGTLRNLELGLRVGAAFRGWGEGGGRYVWLLRSSVRGREQGHTESECGDVAIGGDAAVSVGLVSPRTAKNQQRSSIFVSIY